MRKKCNKPIESWPVAIHFLSSILRMRMCERAHGARTYFNRKFKAAISDGMVLMFANAIKMPLKYAVCMQLLRLRIVSYDFFVSVFFHTAFSSFSGDSNWLHLFVIILYAYGNSHSHMHTSRITSIVCEKFSLRTAKFKFHLYL